MDNRKNMTREQMIAREEDFPTINGWGDRKAVCKRCHCVMNDCEPMDLGGCFYHPTKDKEGKPHWCQNSGKQFSSFNTELRTFLT